MKNGSKITKVIVALIVIVGMIIGGYINYQIGKEIYTNYQTYLYCMQLEQDRISSSDWYDQIINEYIDEYYEEYYG